MLIQKIENIFYAYNYLTIIRAFAILQLYRLILFIKFNRNTFFKFLVKIQSDCGNFFEAQFSTHETPSKYKIGNFIIYIKILIFLQLSDYNLNISIILQFNHFVTPHFSVLFNTL